PVDPGLADWAGAYFNEQLVGRGLGARMLRSRLLDADLGPTERAFVEQLAPAFTTLEETAESTLYVDGAHRPFSESRLYDLTQRHELMEFIERRAALLSALQQALDTRGVNVRIGTENALPALRHMSLV